MKIINSGNEKLITTDKYQIYFNRKTGLEITRGINGNPDPFILDFPSLLDVGVMSKCYNNCPFCYQGDNKDHNMYLHDYKRIIDEGKENGLNQVALGGKGDADTHENFEDILKYTRENDVVPNYTTSGIKMTPEKAEISKKYCGAVAVSQYEQPFTFNAIKMLQDADVKTNIHWMLSSKSYENIIRCLNGEDVWNGKIDLTKINAIIFLLFKPQGKGKELNDEYSCSNEQLEIFAKNINNKLPFKIGMDSCTICRIRKYNVFSKLQDMMIDNCESSRQSAYISYDMKLIPCSFTNISDATESIRITNSSIKEIWQNNIVFNYYRKLLMERPTECPVFRSV